MTAVAFELLVVGALALTGLLLAPRAQWPAGVPVAAALPLGLAALTGVELVLMSSGLPIAHPRVALLCALALAVLAAVLWLGVQWPSPGWLLGGLGMLLVVVVVTVQVPLVNVTADSFRYVLSAGVLAEYGDPEALSAFQLQKRSLAVGLVHGLASADPGYLRAIGPLTGISTVALLFLAVREHLARLDPSVVRVIAVGAAALLATNHRFVFSSLYLNGHGFFAVWLLVLVIVVLTVRRDPLRANGPAGLMAVLAATAITLVRPEGALVSAMALAPLALDSSLATRWRRAVLASVGVAVVLWHVAVVGRGLLEVGSPLSVSLLGMTAVGVGLVLVALALPLVDRLLPSRPLLLLHGLAWLAAVLLAIRAPSILRTSAIATARNVTSDGVWGISLLLLAVLLIVGVAWRRIEGEDALLFPLATFIPLALLLAFLRGDGGGPYRIGPGDSLNRMLVHLLPTAILLLALLASSVPRWSSSREERLS